MTVDASGNVVGYDDYYPYGMTMTGRSLTPSGEDSRYKFVSNERDASTGLDHLGDRNYDSWSGRELTVDPFEVKYPAISPYSYASNNPIVFYDANGDSTHINDNNEYETDPITVLGNKNTPWLGTPMNYNTILSGFYNSLSHEMLSGSLAGIDNAGQFISDNSSLFAGGLFVGGFFTEGATWAFIPDALTAASIGDWTSTGAKVGEALTKNGTWQDAKTQAGFALFNTVLGKGLDNLSERITARTGLSNVLYRNVQTGRFISNNFGNTFEAVKDAANVPISFGIRKFTDKNNRN